MPRYTEVRSGFTVEPESCAHNTGGRHASCVDCGLTPKLLEREKMLRAQGFSVDDIAELGLLD
jgi:hypothetical protein